jgi:hypothetical protein
MFFFGTSSSFTCCGVQASNEGKSRGVGMGCIISAAVERGDRGKERRGIYGFIWKELGSNVENGKAGTRGKMGNHSLHFNFPLRNTYCGSVIGTSKWVDFSGWLLLGRRSEVSLKHNRVFICRSVFYFVDSYVQIRVPH